MASIYQKYQNLDENQHPSHLKRTDDIMSIYKYNPFTRALLYFQVTLEEYPSLPRTQRDIVEKMVCKIGVMWGTYCWLFTKIISLK